MAEEQVKHVRLILKTMDLQNPIEVPYNIGIEDLRKIIAAQFVDTKPEQVFMCYRGQPMIDENNLKDYYIKNSEIVQVIINEPITIDVNRTSFGLNVYGGLDDMGALYGMGPGTFLDLQQQMQTMLHNDEAMLQRLLANPMVQQLLNNPSILRQLLAAHPEMESLMQLYPDILETLRNPELLRRTLELSRNPVMLRSLMRNRAGNLSISGAVPSAGAPRAAGAASAVRGAGAPRTAGALRTAGAPWTAGALPGVGIRFAGAVRGTARAPGALPSVRAPQTAVGIRFAGALRGNARALRVPHGLRFPAAPRAARSPGALPTVHAAGVPRAARSSRAATVSNSRKTAVYTPMSRSAPPPPPQQQQQRTNDAGGNLTNNLFNTATMQSLLQQMAANPMMMENLLDAQYTRNVLNRVQHDPQIISTLLNTNPLWSSSPDQMDQVNRMMPQIISQMQNNQNARNMLTNPNAIDAIMQIQSGIEQLRNAAPNVAASLGIPGTSVNAAYNIASGREANAELFADFMVRMISDMTINCDRAQPPELRYQAQLMQLTAMGFTNNSENLEILIGTSGDINKAVIKLLAKNDNE